MTNSPTIVAAALSDQTLKDSINKLVAEVNGSVNKMAENFNTAIGSMEAKLKSLGSANVVGGGKFDGGSSRRVRAQKEEEEQVKRTTLSYDNQAAAIKNAAQSASALIQQERAELRSRQAEVLGRIKFLQRQYGDVEIKLVVRDDGTFTRAVNSAKEKIQEIRQRLQEVPPTSVLGKQFSQELQQARNEYNELLRSRKAFEAQNEIGKLSEENQKLNNKLMGVATAYRSIYSSEKQAEEAFASGATAMRQYGDSADKAYQKMLKLSYQRAINISATDTDLAVAKLERLRAILSDHRFLGALSPSELARAKKEAASLENSVGALLDKSRERVSAQRSSKTTLEIRDEEEAIRKAAAAEKKWTEDIKLKGFAAQATSRMIIKMLNDEAQAGGKGLMGFFKIDDKDVSAVHMLETAIRDMKAQYATMSDTERDSAIGRALKRDIEYAEKASGAISAYNKAASGIESGARNASSRSIVNYESLKNVIKELTQQYYSMSTAEIKAGSANVIVDKLQRTNRELQELQNRLNRPISFEAAMRGSEKTLDDIAYKMQRLRLYRQGIDLTKPGAEEDIKKVDEALIKLQKDADKWMSKSKDMLDKNNALGRSWNYMKNRLAFYFTVGASTQFIKNLIEVRSQYEMNERALGILIDSAERGTQIFNELSQMALVSPYTLIELSSAAKQLTAYDVAAKDVVDTTRRLADMAAAVGIPIERLTYALGQIKAYGYLNSRDARMFANAGIPLVKQLSEYYTELEGKLVSTADVYDRIKKKAIDYNEVMEVINHMTDQGGKFFDFQAKMADTLKVRLANLTLAWNNMLNEMGKETQGVLTFGIGALRDLFLRWKDLDKAIKSAAWILGLKVGLDFLLFGLNRAHLALGLTTHRMALAEVVGKRLAATMTAVGRSLYSLASSRMTWITLAVMAAVELISALNGANEAQKALNESIRNGAKDNYNNISKFLEQYKDLRESLYETRKVAIGNIYDPSSRKAAATAYSEESFAKDIDNNEAKKAWEAIREQIELTTSSSDRYIQSLLSIKNMSERVRQAFNILEDIKVVNAALQELDEDTIKIEKDMSGWWNLWQMPDGLIGNLKDYSKELDSVIEKYGSVAAMKDNTFLGGKGSDDLNDYQTALERFRDDLKVTTDSIINFIELKGWSGDVNKINETFKQITQKLVLDNQLDPQKAFILQTEVEEARSEAAKKALLQRINDEKAALAQTADEESRNALTKSINDNINEYNTWNEFNGRKKVEWERFTKWLKEQHISETTAMFRNMDAEDIKSLNFQEGKHAEWVTRMVTQYAKEHKMSYDEAFNYLKSWVKSANQWSVFIPLIISTEKKKSVYEQLGEYDKLVDEADAQIERLEKRVKELGEKEKLTKEETEELTNANQELTQAYKDKADAESHGGHGKKEKKDERAATKAQKQAESELQKALKEELQLIDKVRSQYKKLTDAGVSRAVAMKTVTEQFGDSIKHINAVLGKNGLPKFDIKSFAGTDNPHEMMVMLKKQIDSAKKVKNIKPEEIKDLEIKYSEIKVDAEAYDATKIKKGLDNELGRLKDEYELAVELDANPELGNMFADMFDIDLDTLPRTAKEYADRYTKSLNKYFKQMSANIELPNMLNLTRDDMKAFQEQVDSNQLQQVYFDLIQKGYEATQAARKKEATDAIKEYDKLLQKYAEYQYKLTQIAKEASNERKALVVQFGNDEQKEQARTIYANLEMEQDPSKREELDKQLKALVTQVAADNEIALQISVAIDKKQAQESAKTSFEEFQKSPEWIVATGDLAGMTDKALGGLIQNIEEYKKKAKDLDPKQIKQINKALSSLYKQQRQGNPFAAIANAFAEAKERADEFTPKIEDAEKELNKLENNRDQSKLAETAARIEELKENIAKWKKEQKEEGEVSASTIVSGITSAMGVAKEATGIFTDMMSAFGDNENVKNINKLFSVLDKTMQGAQIGASFGVYGAAIGAIAGAASGIFTAFSDEISGNALINDELEKSVSLTKMLESTYRRLEDAMEDAYGVAEIGAKRAMAVNKELQLAELKRQLTLEESRKEKNKDQEKINELHSQISDLQLEIQDSAKDIVNSLLGISSVGDTAESLVSSMIDAFKSGEDYMGKYVETFNNMIDNMIMKSIVGRVIGERLEQMFKEVEEISVKRADEIMFKPTDFTGGSAAVLAGSYERTFSEWASTLENWMSNPYDTEENRKQAEEWLNNLRKLYTEAATPTVEDISAISEKRDEWQTEVKDIFDAYMKAFGISYGQDATNTLSALQQGIQGITEDTAGALEAYMNGVSQQVYLQSDYLRQIVEIMTMQSALTDDAKVATLSQMLLQLQASYQTQEAIRGILEGWSSPNGLAVRVQMD